MRAVISDPERCAASTTTTPSAAPEISRLRLGKSRGRHVPERHFGNRAAGRNDRRQQVLVLGRIDLVVTAGQYRHGAARKAGAVRRLINAARQAGCNDKAGFAEIARQGPREFQPGAGSIARADDGNHRPHQHVKRAAHAEQRRRIVEGGEARRVAGFAGRDEADAYSFARGKLGACIFLAKNPPRTRRAAAPRKVRQPLQRRLRAAEMIDQRTKRARPDIVGTDQPQPVDPLLAGEVCCA